MRYNIKCRGNQIREIKPFEPLDIENTYVHTIWGLAQIKDGYLKVNNSSKAVHRYLYQKYHGIALDSKTHIHHKNGDKLCNHISNLVAVTPQNHRQLHKQMNKQKVPKLYQHTDSYFPRVLIDYFGNYVYLYKYSSNYNPTPKIGAIRDTNLQYLKNIVHLKGLIWDTTPNILDYDNNYFYPNLDYDVNSGKYIMKEEVF